MQIQRKKKIGIIIFDLDGCVADDSWRLPFIDMSLEGDARYHKYHTGINEDAELSEGYSRVCEAFNKGVQIAFITARPSTYFQQTLDWIDRKFGFLQLQVDFLLFMREPNDLRSSPDFKKDATLELAAMASRNRTIIIGAFDDRDDVVGMYRELGIPAYILDAEGTDAPEITIINAGTDRAVAAPLVAMDESQPVVPVEAEAFDAGAKAVSGEPISEELRESIGKEQWDDLGEPEVKEKTFQKPSADLILFNAAQTFAERNATYRDNAVVVGQVMRKLFPNGVKITTEADHHFYHLFELMIVKLTRFANSNLKHVDSLHDLMVYAAMCETTIDAHSIEVLE